MRAVISAGGTGGHIFPAVAIINKIKKEEPNSEFLYIGTDDRMEKDFQEGRRRTWTGSFCTVTSTASSPRWSF